MLGCAAMPQQGPPEADEGPEGAITTDPGLPGVLPQAAGQVAAAGETGRPPGGPRGGRGGREGATPPAPAFRGLSPGAGGGAAGGGETAPPPAARRADWVPWLIA